MQSERHTPDALPGPPGKFPSKEGKVAMKRRSSSFEEGTMLSEMGETRPASQLLRSVFLSVIA